MIDGAYHTRSSAVSRRGVRRVVLEEATFPPHPLGFPLSAALINQIESGKIVAH